VKNFNDHVLRRPSIATCVEKKKPTRSNRRMNLDKTASVGHISHEKSLCKNGLSIQYNSCSIKVSRAVSRVKEFIRLNVSETSCISIIRAISSVAVKTQRHIKSYFFFGEDRREVGHLNECIQISRFKK
jgi:hypothetical protein